MDFQARRLFQVFLCCTIGFSIGLLASIGAFTEPVEKSANPPNSLDGVWPGSMVLLPVISGATMLYVGLHLSGTSEQYLEYEYCRLLFLSALLFLLFGISSLGVALQYNWLILLCISLLGVSIGVNTIVATEHILKWTTPNSQIAMGMFTMSIRLGSIAYAWLISHLCLIVSVTAAISFSAMITAAFTAVVTAFLRLPNIHSQTNFIENSYEQGEGLDLDFPNLTWRSAVVTFSFWIYLFVLMILSVPFSFFPYFFKIGQVFKQSGPLVLSTFQKACVGSAITGMVTPVLSGRFKFGSGVFSSSHRNIFFILLATQTCLFFNMTSFTEIVDYGKFVQSVGALIVLRGSFMSTMTLLAVDMFGEKNSALVFGAGGGVACCLGESFGIILLAVEDLMHNGKDRQPQDFFGFYRTMVVLSTFGTASMLFFKRACIS